MSAFFRLSYQSNTSLIEKFLRLLITNSIKEGECSDTWKCFACQFEKGSSHIQGIDFDQSYSPVAHSDYLRINIAIAAMHRLTASILYVSNELQNKNVTINERLCVSTPPYYLDWFEIFYRNIILNQDYGPFFLQHMNGIQGKTPAGQQCNRILDPVVTNKKYKRSTIDYEIYTKELSDVTVSYLIVLTDDVFNTNNNETSFPEVRNVFEEYL